jgi:hypothetical protein
VETPTLPPALGATGELTGELALVALPPHAAIVVATATPRIDRKKV